MRAKKKIYQYVMLLVSIVVLMSVVIPHHHHSNGLPCYKSLSAEAAHGGCNGHNVALYTSVFSHVTDGNVNQYLFPLLVLFDYINPPVPAFYKLLFEKDRTYYIESLHDTWIASASGLRAPPYEFDL